MQVNSINSLSYKRTSLVSDSQQSNNYIQRFSLSQDKFVRTSQPKSCDLAFRGKPYTLRLVYPKTMSVEEAWKLYEELALGNYLDIEQPTWNGSCREPSYYSETRKENLSFLDKITTTRGKKAFIRKYKELTGFPDLAKVSKKIENEFCKSIDKMSKEIGLYNGLIIRAGYNSTCSVGKGSAFPGSDLDGAYVILQGCNPLYDDRLVEEAKGYLWNATDQRLLSYNHNSAFPQIYTLPQIKAMMRHINYATRQMNLHGDKTLLSSIFTNLGAKTLMDKYRESILIYNTDYCEANKFFIELSKQFPDKSYGGHYDAVYENPTKELLKNFGFFLDVFRNGTHFEKYEKNNPTQYPTYKDDILESDVSKLTNLLQLRALKRSQEIKPKIERRKNLREEFDTWDVDKQYEFIKTLIKASCGENEPDKFPEYFTNGPDYFKPLLKALGKKG